MTYPRISAAAVVFAAALAVPAGAQASGYQEEVLKDTPLTYLPMQDVTPTTVPDFSGNHRDGWLGGSAAPIAQGPFATAGGGLALKSGSVTADVPAKSGAVELWVNPAKLVRNQEAGLVAHGDPKGNGWAIGVGAKRKLAFVTGGRHAGSKVTLPANVWSMLTVTWDTAKVRFVVNGGATDKQAELPAAAPASADGQLTLGGTARGAFRGSYEGHVDEVALYSKLNIEDTRRHYEAAKLPINTAPVVVGGPPVVGQPVVVVPGQWADTTTATAYQWQRCEPDGDECEDIPNATGASYTVTLADACSTLRVVETVTNAAGSSTVISEPSVVVPGPCPGESGGTGGTGTDGTGTTGTGTTGTDSTGTDTTGTGTGDSGASAIGTQTPDATAAGDAAAAAGAASVGGVATAALEGSATPRSAAGTCLRIVSGRQTVKLRRLGILRVRAAGKGCITASSPLRVTFAKAKGKRIASVKYRLGAKALRIAKRGGYAVAVKPSELKAGVQVLKVRVAARGAKARTVTLKLRLAKA